MTRDSKHLDIVRFFQVSPNLKELNLARTMVPGEVFQSFIEVLPYLERLDVSDNSLGDSGVIAFLETLKTHKNLRELILDRNFDKPSKLRTKAMTTLGSLINSETCKIEKLSLQGTKGFGLRSDLLPFIFSLMANRTVKSLNISNNACGNGLALALAKMLQANKTVEVLHWDENGTNLQGYLMFYVGLLKNQALREMPIPLADIAAAGKEKEKEIIKIMNDIQQYLFKLTEMKTQASPRPSLSSKPSRRQNRAGLDTGRASVLFGELADHLDDTDELTPQELEALKKELGK